MDKVGSPDYLYNYLMVLPLMFAAAYMVGSRLGKWLKARYKGFRNDVFQACLWLMVFVAAYFFVAPAPGSQGEVVYFKSSPFSGKSDYWKAVEKEISRQLEVPRLLHVPPLAAFGAGPGRDETRYKQFSALEGVGLYERKEWQALDLDGTVESFALSEKGEESYHFWRQGLDYGDISFQKLIYWHYVGRRNKEWRQITLSRRGAPTRSENVAEYSESAPRRAVFAWEFSRLEDWARAPAVLAAFPLLRDQLEEPVEREHAILVYGGRLYGLNPWHDAELPSNYYLRYPVVNLNQVYQPKADEVHLNSQSIFEALDNYLYTRTGFVRLAPGSEAAKLVARKEKASREGGWDKLDAAPIYEKKWADLRIAEAEQRKNSPYGSLGSMNAVSKNISNLTRLLNEDRRPPESPNPLPPAFEPGAPGQHRFAVLQADKIVQRGPAYAKKTPDGWLYQEVSFTCKLAKQAVWARDQDVLRALPALGRVLAEAEERTFTWILRYKEPDIAVDGVTRYNCEVFFDRARASGI